jgi:hypothetical protein
MLLGSYIENIKSTLVFAFILFIILYLVIPSKFMKYPVFFITFFTFLSLVNLFHRFTHQRDCETHYIILQLQKWGILCSHDHHRQHHVEQSDGKYCTILPITNYILDTIYFWRFLEVIISIVGVKPDRKPVYEHYEPIHNYMHKNSKKECPKRPTEKDVDILLNNLENHATCHV